MFKIKHPCCILFYIKLQTATLLKRDSNTDVFLWILRNFLEHLFWRTTAYSWFWSDFRKWLFRTFFLDNRFQNHADLGTLPKYQSLSSQGFKQNWVNMPSLKLTPKIFFNLGFVCSSLTVTTEKANACSPWTSCFIKDISNLIRLHFCSLLAVNLDERIQKNMQLAKTY